MANSRHRYSGQLKFQLALEAAKEQRTLNELASERGIHPNQISQWKKHLLEHGPDLFNGHSHTHPLQAQQEREAQLFEQIGRLKMELEWVKKKAGLHTP